MAEPNDGDEEEAVAVSPPPTEEERHTETVDDEVKPKGEPEPSEPDVSVRLDALERELAALKAMMDTLGYTEPAPSDNDDDGDDGRAHESIEDLFN